MTVASLREALAEMKSTDLDLGAVVKGSDDVDYQHMVDVLDVLHQPELTKVGLANERSHQPMNAGISV